MLVHQFTPAEIVILIVVTISAVTDLINRKIYNWLTLPTVLAGVVISGLHGFAITGASGAVWAVFWAAVGCLIGAAVTAGPGFLKSRNFVYGGDVKICAALGACLLPVQTLICLFYFALAYGAISACVIAKAMSSRQSDEIEKARKSLIPVGPAIAFGTYLGILFDKPLMHFMGFSQYH